MKAVGRLKITCKGGLEKDSQRTGIKHFQLALETTEYSTFVKPDTPLC
jgi:hypothetical protein